MNAENYRHSKTEKFEQYRDLFKVITKEVHKDLQKTFPKKNWIKKILRYIGDFEKWAPGLTDKLHCIVASVLKKLKDP